MSKPTLAELHAADLKALAERQTSPCRCALGHCRGWESVSDDRWPAKQMVLVGTLRQPLAPGQTEPTFEEFHPQGTRYESPNAPIAPDHFPFNRCDVHACQQCGCAVLKYTEFGGYYVDHRVRLVDAALVVGS
jgi:hypothetical protein